MLKTFATLLTLFSLTAVAQEAVVDVKLFPAGDFKATTKDVKGSATQKGDTVEAKNIVVNLKNLKTQKETRDKHTQDYLNTAKYPEAVLVSAKGKGGKGEGVIRIKGIEKKIAGTYKVEGSTLIADFPIKFSEFDIKNVKFMGVGVEDDGMIHVKVPLTK